MSEFKKQVYAALKHDEWEVHTKAMRHRKTNLVIEYKKCRMPDVPQQFNFIERIYVRYLMRRMQDHAMAARFVHLTMNPKKPGRFGEESSFMYDN